MKSIVVFNNKEVGKTTFYYVALYHIFKLTKKTGLWQI